MNNQGIYTKAGLKKSVYIYTESENFILPKFWGLHEKEEKPVGVAIIADKNLLVALEGSDNSLELLDWSKDLKSTKCEDIEAALKDQNGEATTAELAELGSPAAQFCANYQAGQLGAGKWYMPTANDFQLMYDHKKELDIALAICGGNAIETDNWHWTSTRRYDKSNWIYCWYDGYRYCNFQNYCGRVRPVSAFLNS
jgi:hypothetical protein